MTGERDANSAERLEQSWADAFLGQVEGWDDAAWSLVEQQPGAVPGA